MGQDYIPLQEGNKLQKYQHLITSYEQRLDTASHPIANLTNLLAMLKEQFNWLWVGLYWVYGGGQCLMLGSFQGPPACTKIFKGDGVCGQCWIRKQPIIVTDTSKFEGHIACSSKSKSQIVIPIFEQQQFVGLLDIDSVNLGQFCTVDKQELSKIIDMMRKQKQWDFFIKAMQNLPK